MRPKKWTIICQTFFAAAALLAMPGLTTQAAQAPQRLDGLYVGRYPKGTQAVVYYFKPSGTVVIAPRRMIDPDWFVGWREVRVAIGEDVPGGKESLDLVIGVYGLGNKIIELHTLELKVNLRLRLLIYEELWKENWEQEKVEVKSFNDLGKLERIEIDGATLVLQKDQTGRKLAGEYACESFGTARYSGRLKISAAGRFTIDEIWTGRYSYPGGENHGTGSYEIQGHDIIFRYSDGHVETCLFGDLEKVSGKETITFGAYVWIKGIF